MMDRSRHNFSRTSAGVAGLYFIGSSEAVSDAKQTHRHGRCSYADEQHRIFLVKLVRSGVTN